MGLLANRDAYFKTWTFPLAAKL